MKLRIAMLVAVLGAAIAGNYVYRASAGVDEPCGDKPLHADDAGSTAAGIEDTVQGSNDFAFDLYGKLLEESGNVFFSPYSISTALAMVYEGARGETASEMQSVFHFPEDTATRQSAFASLHNLLNPSGAAYQLSAANSLWAQHDYAFLPAYTDILKSRYAAEANTADFAADPEAERLRINAWVEGKTRDKIKDLFPEGSIKPITRLALVNAIYFKGDWQEQFDPAQTADADFMPEGAEPVTVPLMNLYGKRFGYGETQDLQALELPYKGGDLSLLLLLPRAGKTLSTIEPQLGAAYIDQLTQGMSHPKVNVHLPKFTINTKYMLSDQLSALGMPAAFTDAADFSGMTGKRDLYIGIVVHQAFVSVDETGTEAAAATGVTMDRMMATPDPPKDFRADHPFLFLIREAQTGAILFLGRVADPTV